MDEAKLIKTLIVTATKLDLDETGPSIEEKLYRGMIGSLLYLTTNKGDIVFSIGLCTRFQAKPKDSHFQAVNKILRYLKRTTDLVLRYLKVSNFYLFENSNANYTGFCGFLKHLRYDTLSLIMSDFLVHEKAKFYYLINC